MSGKSVSIPVRRDRSRRRLILFASFAVLAVGSVSVVSVVSFGDHHPPQQAAASPVAATLQLAARAASLPAVTPRSSQFYYVKIHFGTGQDGQFWQSIDGEHSGFMIRPDLGGKIAEPGCVNGVQQVVSSGNRSHSAASCVVRPAYDANFASTVPAAKSALVGTEVASATAGKTASINTTAKDALERLELTYLTPVQRGNLLTAISQLPDLAVNKDVKDAFGRSVITVSWNVDAASGTVVQSFSLDPTTLDLVSIGSNDTIVQSAVVDQAGQTS